MEAEMCRLSQLVDSYYHKIFSLQWLIHFRIIIIDSSSSSTTPSSPSHKLLSHNLNIRDHYPVIREQEGKKESVSSGAEVGARGGGGGGRGGEEGGNNGGLE